jgi:diguanylate cyclase (GGDEF)-like protein
MALLTGDAGGKIVPWRSAAYVAVATVAVLAFLEFGSLTEDGRGFIRDGSVLLLPLATLPMAIRAGTAFSRWIYAIAIAALSGQAIWIVERYGFDYHGEPSLATIPWLLAYALGIGAIVRWPARVNSQLSLRHTLDSLTIAAGVFALAWVYVLGPKLLDRQSFSMELLLDVVYVTIDMLFFLAFMQAFRKGVDARYRTSTALAVLALVIVALADFGDLLAGSSSVLSDMSSLAWAVAISFLNIAAHTFSVESTSANPVSTTKPRLRWREELPYLGLVPVAVLLFGVSHDPAQAPYEFGVKLAALLLTASLGLRQYLALRDNERLIDSLKDTQSELESRNDELSHTQEDLTEILERLSEKNDELAHANEQLARLVTVDGMTGLGNHRAFHERLRLEVEAARRFSHPLSVLVADLDHFRRFNDAYGHPAGDEVLRQVAKILFDSVDLKAYPARYGGEEFAIILPYVTTTESIDVARRIGLALSQRSAPMRVITLSFGVAGSEGNSHSAELLVSEAFRALDAAKERGRNQIVLAEDLDRGCIAIHMDNQTSVFDPKEPMGLAGIISAGLRSHPQALTLEPDAQLVSGLLGTLQLKDLETRDHSERVMWYALRLAQAVIENDAGNMTQQDLRSLAYGALLHDIGKIGVPESILKFPGQLTEEMRNVIREHPRLGAQLVMKFPSLELALPVIRYHHERWDGAGYPLGIARRDIPLVARIFAVVDALEALTSQRPYKDPVPIERVTEILIADAGSHFDPAIVDAYLTVPMAEWKRIRDLEHSLASVNLARPVFPPAA